MKLSIQSAANSSNKIAMPLLGFLLAGTMLASSAWAHFPWLVLTEDSQAVEVYFGEDAESNDEELVAFIAKSKLWQFTGDGAQPLETKLTEESLSASLPADKQASLILLSHDLGVLEKGGAPFLLKYGAKTGPSVDAEIWQKDGTGKVLSLDLIPVMANGKVSVKTLWQGKPAAGCQVIVTGPGMEDLELSTDPQGTVQFEPAKAGLYSIRARHINEQSGTEQGKKYDSIRHYTTLALPVDSGSKPKTSAVDKSTDAHRYPDLPLALTSFGAAIAGNQLFAYGGHTGEAHSYSTAEQSNQLLQLDLNNPSEWKTIAKGPRLQGLALVAWGEKLYRIGGFTAKNAEGEDHDLWSQDFVAAYDFKANAWQDLPSLPEPRSSFDAAVMENKIYVVGGWQLRGEEDSLWHKTAWQMDPSTDKPSWEPLTEPPFQRRALALAEYQGKLYALGGMESTNKPSTRVDIYDPQAKSWSRGPDLPGKPMEGFGCAAFAAAGRLYASTMSGKLLRLSVDGTSWEEFQQLETARFFHRMLPKSQHELVFLGGANMGIGKFQHIDVIEVSP